MSANILREAAALMRTRAEAATPGPWRVHPSEAPGIVSPDDWVCDYDALSHSDAEHVAAADPVFMLAVADLLEAQAALIEQYGDFTDVEGMGDANALEVARTYLRSES